jgi:ABC-2 type transport system permease protein
MLTFLIPIVLCLLFGLIKFDKTSIRIGILEAQNGSKESDEMEQLYKYLDESEGISYAPADSKSLNTDLMTGKFQVILDYTSNSKMQQFQLITYQNNNRRDILKAALVSAVTENKPLQLSGYQPEGLSATERSTALLVSLFLIFSVIHASSIIRDRQDGMLQRYLFARKAKASYVAGYMMHIFILTLIQILVCMGVLLIVQKNFRPVLIEAILISTLIAGVSSIFSIIICMGSKSVVQANITASSLAAVMSILGGTFVSISAMPWLLRMLSYASPIRWMVEFCRLF